MIGENSTEFVNLLLDIWNSGNCAVLIDWRIPFESAIRIMKEANVTLCYFEEKNNTTEYCDGIEFISFKRTSNYAETLPFEIYCKYRTNYSLNEAVIIYSSGTTGKSKGIILSHYAINTNSESIIDYMNLKSDECICIVKSLSHSSTLVGELLVALKTKTKLVITPTVIIPRVVFEIIRKQNVTILCLNPTLLALYTDEIKKYDDTLETLETIYVSGSILNDKTYENAHKYFKNISIYNVYGLSEAGPRVTAQRAGCCLSNSVGKPIKNIQVAIIDNCGNKVVNGISGIVHVKTPSLLSGYVSGELKESKYNSWLNTGDVGYFDTNGELHIVSRIDDVINFESHKIYPNEIENYILKSDKIKECIVINVYYNSTNFLVALCVGQNFTEHYLRNYLKKEFPHYEIPRRFLKCSSLPKNINGKILKDAAHDIVLDILERESK